MDNLVSIIVPFFNAEKYINECIDSLINQTYSNIEIILIDNASNDNSKFIAKEYSELDSRIILIQENDRGVSKARNKGIKLSKGKYIVFVDADDYLEQDAIEKEVRIIKEGKNEIVFFEFFKNRSAREKSSRILEYREYESDKINVIKEMAGGEYFSSIWRGIYNSEMIKSNNILFKDIKFGEDLIFNIECILASHSVLINNNAYYHYMDNEDSSLKSLQYDPQNTIDYYEALGEVTKNNNIKELEGTYIVELRVCLSRILDCEKKYSLFKKWISQIELLEINSNDKVYRYLKSGNTFRLYLIFLKKKILRKFNTRYN